MTQITPLQFASPEQEAAVHRLCKKYEVNFDKITASMNEAHRFVSPGSIDQATHAAYRQRCKDELHRNPYWVEDERTDLEMPSDHCDWSIYGCVRGQAFSQLCFDAKSRGERPDRAIVDELFGIGEEARKRDDQWLADVIASTSRSATA